MGIPSEIARLEYFTGREITRRTKDHDETRLGRRPSAHAGACSLNGHTSSFTGLSKGVGAYNGAGRGRGHGFYHSFHDVIHRQP
jgi:hypothetical protein